MPLPDISATEAAVIELTNAFRRENALAEVRADPKLTAAARAYADYLAKTGTFSHTADGRDVSDRVTAAGYAWCSVGENLALHLDSSEFEARALAKKSVEGWINSPSHRDNMLTRHATDIGVAVARVPDRNPKFVTVQLLARPKSFQYTFQISNASTAALSYTFDGERQDLAPRTAVTHTACTPGVIEFEGVGTAAVRARYEASDGMLYTVEGDARQGLKIELGQRRAASP